MPFVQTHPNSPLFPPTVRQILHVLQGSLLLIEMAKFLPRETINHVFSLNGVQSSVKGRGVGMKQPFTSYVTLDHIPTNSQSPFSSIMTWGWSYWKDGIVIKIQSLLFQEKWIVIYGFSCHWYVNNYYILIIIIIHIIINTWARI